MSEAYIGEIRLLATTYAPENWVLCDGRQLPIVGSESLFALIGAIYGGDGVHNFGVPDLRGRVPVSVGKSVSGTEYDMGQYGGAYSTVLTQKNVPPHAHGATFAATGVSPITAVNINVNPNLGESASPSGYALAGSKQASGAGANSYAVLASATTGASLGGVNATNGDGCVCLLAACSLQAQTPVPTVPPQGGQPQVENIQATPTPVPTVPPLVALNYVICAVGSFPATS